MITFILSFLLIIILALKNRVNNGIICLLLSNHTKVNSTEGITMEKRSSFSGQLGFVIAASGSAVGLGNIWRFPYLAAKYGGGIFLLVYLILLVTFGYTLMLTENAIGRKTGKGPLIAFAELNKKWGFIGIIATVIPAIIMPYYNVIGGWVLKYLVMY